MPDYDTEIDDAAIDRYFHRTYGSSFDWVEAAANAIEEVDPDLTKISKQLEEILENREQGEKQNGE